MSEPILGPAGEKFFEDRGISAETAVRFGIYTAKRAGHETVPSASGNIIVFPFWEDDRIVNEKFRGPDKRFWQRSNGKSVFWNADALKDPLFVGGHMPLVITEGEMDALAAIQCGFPLTVSVPEGAPPATGSDSVAITSEPEGKFRFCWNARTDLAGDRKRFILAVDNDAPGRRLADELVRRLFASRCLFVEYPEGCKDLNDALIRHGPEAVAAVLNAAKPWPVRGLYRVSDYPELPEIETFSTGWPILDRHFRLFAGEFCVMTGIPSHGKSTFALNLLLNVAKLHGWRSAIFTPEMPAVPFIRNRLRDIYGRDRDHAAISSFLEDRFVFIDADPTGGADDDFTVDWMLDKATEAVMRDGVRCLLIDPWNELEHARAPGESMTDYIGRSIRQLKRFARLRNVAIIVIAHPTKDVWREGKSRIPSLYDIEGSAHWFNKSDHGLIIERASTDGEVSIHVAKSRFLEAGERGTVRMRFERWTSRFVQFDEPAAQLDEEPTNA